MIDLTIAVSEVASDYRITVPEEIRKELRITGGMQAVWYIEKGMLKVYFRKRIKSLKELRGIINGPRNLSTLSVEDLIEKEHR